MSKPKNRKRLYQTIPGDVDVLLTHGPPYGIIDGAPDIYKRADDEELLERVMEIQPLIHIFTSSAMSTLDAE